MPKKFAPRPSPNVEVPYHAWSHKNPRWECHYQSGAQRTRPYYQPKQYPSTIYWQQS